MERRKYTVTPAATQGYLTRIPNKDILTQKATYSELVARFGLRVPAKPGVYPHAAVIAAGVPFPLNPPQTPGRAAPTELELNLRAASRGQMVRVVVQFQRGLESGELPDRQQDVLTAETHLNASDCPYLYAPAEDSDKRTELERLWHIASVEAEAEAASRVLPPLCNAASAARLERVRTMRVILSKMRARLNALKERRAASDTECTRLRGALAELQEPAATAAKRRIAQAMESASPLVLMCTAGTQTGPIDPRAVLLPEENALDTLLAACGCGRIDSLWGSPRILPRHSVALTFAGSVHLTVDIPRARAVLALAKIGDNGSGNGNGDVSSSSVGVWSDWAGMCVNSLNDAVLGKAGGNRNLLGSALTEVARKLEDVYALKTDLEEAAMAVPLEFVSTPGEPPAVIATLTTSSFRLSVTLRAGLVDKNGVPCIQNHPAASYSWDFAGPVTVWWWSRSAASQAGRRVDINKDELFKKRDTPVKTSLTELLQTLKEGFERVAQTKIGLI